MRHAMMAMQALAGTVRLSEESWYLWGEVGAARLAGAQQLARGLLSNDLQSLLRDTNVSQQLWTQLARDHEEELRAERQAETPRNCTSHLQLRVVCRSSACGAFQDTRHTGA